MVKTIIRFVLPFVLVDEDSYNVKVGENVVKVTMELIQDKERLEKITGMKLSGNGKMRMIPDVHGIANYSKVTIELPYFYEPDDTRDFSKLHPLKIEAMNVINRLVDVVRVCTLQPWIRRISPRDISQFQYDRINDSGKVLPAMVMDAGQGYSLPFPKKEQKDVETEIIQILSSDVEILIENNLLLDSISYFEEGRFNESVIVANIAFENLIENHLLERLIKQGLSIENAKRETSRIFSRANKKKSVLGTILTKEFVKLGKKSLEDFPILKEKFYKIRDIRKNATHPKTKRIDIEEAKYVIFGITELGNWILKDSN